MEVFNGIIITEGGNLMNKNILIGIFSPLFYFLVNNIMRYTILAVEYNDKYALFHNMLIITLPALPGISLVFLLIRSSLKEYFKYMAKLKNTFTQLQTGSVNAYEKDNVLFVERIDKNGKITAAVNCGNTEYFIENKIPMSQDTATALLYGIKIDTANLTRGVSNLDLEIEYNTFHGHPPACVKACCNFQE